MKTIHHLVLAGLLAALCSAANAQTSYSNSLVGATLVYSNSFSGGATDINGAAPTYINPNASTFGGVTTALFDVVTNNAAYGFYAYQDGTLGASMDSVLLPFTPVSGYVYTLSASLTFAKQPPSGGWGALGFAANFPASNGSTSDPRLSQALVNGNPWALLNYAAQGGGAVFYDTRTHSLGGVANLMSQLNMPYTINMIIDTTGPAGTKWHTALFVAGTLVKETNYTTNPTIKSFGYGQTTTTAGAYQWNALTLSAAPIVILKQPASAGVSAGSAFTNTVVVAATSPAYQWFKDGAPISGATSASLVLNPVAAADASDNYYVVITNSLSLNAVTSSVASLTVHTSPVIISQLPATYTNTFTLFAGTNPRFSISADGEQPISYQWYTNGVAAAGQTSADFTWTNVPAGTITCYCTAANSAGSTPSAAWTASVLASPTAPYPQAVLQQQPLGYWRLNEGPDDSAGDKGVVALDYAGGNNGLYTNAVLGVMPGYSSSTDPGVGAVYFASFASPDSDVFNINGVDLGVAAGNNATFSVTAWVTGIGTQPSVAGIISKGYGGAEQFVLDVSGGKYEFAVRDAAGVLHSAISTTGPTGGWDYLVGVCDQAHSNVTLYVNGAPAGSASIAPASGLLASSVPMTIGARSSSATIGRNDLQFSGLVNDVAIFKSTLSVNQEAALYTAAGYSITPSFVPPPSTFVFQANKTMTIPASAFGATNMGYYWTDMTTGTQLATGSINTYATLDATLSIPNASASLSGHQLELIISNETTLGDWVVTLYSPPAPITLDYSNPILYSNYFNGGTWSIAGNPLTAANALVGGTNALWVQAQGTNNTGRMQANGIDASTLGDSWVLPFTPRAGYVYTIDASLTFTGNPGSWVGLGFALSVPTNSNGARFSDNPPYGYDWLILNEATANVQYFGGGGGNATVTNANYFFSPALGTHTVQVVLDTTGARWKYYASIDGVGTVTNAYSSNPAIGAVGLTQTALSYPGNVQWNYFALSQVAPVGAPPYLLAPLPPTSVTLLADTALSIPATAFGSMPLGYTWSNTNTAAVLASGSTTTVAPLSANLSVSTVPYSWNGNTLALVLTNAYGTNVSLVSLVVTNAVNITPTNLLVSMTGGNLSLTWPLDHTGWRLQTQTNNPSMGLGTNWVDVAGASSTNQVTVAIDPAVGSVFYRMVYP